MRVVSLVMAYYDNPNMLGHHVHKWLGYSDDVRSSLRIIVVDDGSPVSPAVDVIRRYHRQLLVRGLDVKVYRVVPDIPWNQDGARNLGMRVCDTEWALMTDMDHTLIQSDAAVMCQYIREGLVSDAYFLPRQFLVDGTEIPVHANTFLFRVADFWRVGGYDEDFAGFYGSDGNFRKCARGLGLRELPVNFGLTVWRREDCDDANTRRYGRKESEFWAARNPTLNAKRVGPPYKAKNPIRFEWRREI